jgi:hypothetical protein
MVACMRDSLRLWLLLSVAWLVGCSSGDPDTSSASSSSGTSSSASSTSSSGGGTGGGASGPCGVDCSTLQTAKCEVSVCNTGQVAGPLNVCIVVPAPDGMACDDGLFCTTQDTCNKGACVGGPQNDCGMAVVPCSSVVCDESSKACSVAAQSDGTACTPTDLCQINGACQASVCVGQPKDCTFSPLGECNTVACDSSTGNCTGTPDPTQDGTPCELTGNLCSANKACAAGQCVGGTPVDCSGLDFGCHVGACDGTTGLCGAVNVATGTACNQGLKECQVGACDATGACAPAMAPNGTACNDHAACTQTDTCAAGVCAGVAVAACQPYFAETFETCPDGWTLMGDWQCGTPTAASPVTPHGGQGVLATQLDGLYHNKQSFDTCTADSPPIDLTHAINPTLSFWAWVHTEGGTFDGWNIMASIDGGTTFQEVTTVTPAYTLMIAGDPAWGGDSSAQGWQVYSANLTAYVGHSIILRYAFRSDPATVYPGVYIDDLLVAEPAQIPLYISTPTPLPDVYAGQDYSVPLVKIGGTSDSTWTIVGGTNSGWLQIVQATGVLYGTPMAVNVGPVSVTVRVQEPTLPSNFVEQTFTFKVKPDVYYTSWEGTCPDGWTLTGDWKCGVPMNVGPAAASDGTQCIGTGIGQNYVNNDTWAGTTATSPAIDLTGVPNPTLQFRMWILTEGLIYDGANLEISADGGVTYTVLNTVTPAYPLTVAGEPAWGGDQSLLGWQLVQADLTAYSGGMVLLRFGFRSDTSNTFAGVFIDDFLIL